MFKKTRHVLLCFSALGVLSACTFSPSHTTQKQTQKSSIDAALERIAAQKYGSGSLAYLETVYKRNTNNVEAALAYAKALRKAGYAETAARTLTPFVGLAQANNNALSEYAASQIILGQYQRAERYAARAYQANEKNYEALHYLAIAQDMLGQHAQAEKNFQRALKNWNNGSPVPVMNNLALNLALQGKVEPAIAMITKAVSLAPQRRDVENNLRTIYALRHATPKTS